MILRDCITGTIMPILTIRQLTDLSLPAAGRLRRASHDAAAIAHEPRGAMPLEGICQVCILATNVAVKVTAT
jgi:hypothetical protein